MVDHSHSHIPEETIRGCQTASCYKVIDNEAKKEILDILEVKYAKHDTLRQFFFTKDLLFCFFNETGTIAIAQDTKNSAGVTNTPQSFKRDGKSVRHTFDEATKK